MRNQHIGTVVRSLAAIFVVALLLCVALPAVSQTAAHPQLAKTSQPAPTATPNPIPSPAQLMFLIRRKYRSRRPPPPFITYTLVRTQLTSYGYPDYVGSYVWHVWCRTSDRAALEREESRLGAHGQLTFKRPSFNVADDPGPPVADLFEKGPRIAPKVSDVPTPEPVTSLPPTIATVSVLGEFDYNVVSAVVENGVLHVVLSPRRDPERNRLRELFVDPKTYELEKLITHDRLFVDDGSHHTTIYPVTFTITLGEVQGYPVMTKLHGEVGGGYYDDGKHVDFDFNDIVFPLNLPSWYFDPSTYASHVDDAPL